MLLIQRAGRLMLVAVLAVSQLGVGSCSKPKRAAAKPGSATAVVDAQSDSADQVLYGVRTMLTDQGVTKGILVAARGLAFEDGTRIELRGVLIEFLDTLGIARARLTAAAGTYLVQSSQVDTRGTVTVVTPAGRKLKSEAVRFDLKRDIIVGDGAYVLSDSVPQRQTPGVGFEFEPRLTALPKPIPPKPSVRKSR